MRDANDPRNEPLTPCVWAGCDSYKEIGLQVPLCGWHYRLVVDDWSATQNRVREEAKRRRAEVARSGWIYYIQVGDLVKIGYAATLATRLAAYPPNSRLLAVEPGTRKLENERHLHFRAYLAEGREWYRPNVELDNWIGDVRAEHGDPAGREYRRRKVGERRPEMKVTRRARTV